MRWRDFLYYQRGEKMAIISLLALILIVLLINVALTVREPNVIVINKNDSIVAAFETLYNSIEVDSSKLYRNKNVTYPNSVRDKSYTNYTSDTSYEGRSNVYQRSDKLKEGEYIYINSVDTAEWKKIPSIGSSFASRIVKYRNLLGGYASIEQLREVYGMDEERYVNIISYIEVDNNVNRLNVNELEFKELLQHPYLSYKQVQVITNLRKRKGDIKSIDELLIFDDFTNDDIIRLKPYLEF